MLVKVSMAKGTAGDSNVPKSFEELFDIYLSGRRMELDKEGFSKLFRWIVDRVMRPYVMVSGKEPKVGHKIWNLNSLDVGWAWFDFEGGNRLWIRVGVVESENLGGSK